MLCERQHRRLSGPRVVKTISTMLLLVTLMVITSVYSQVATPPRRIGFPFFREHPSAKIHLEIFIDLLCGDSQEAWPHVKEVANYYGPHQMALTVHLFPLPFHRNSFYASRAMFVIHYLTNGTKTFDWMDKILLEKIPELNGRSFHDRSDADLLQEFSTYASEMDVNVTSFLEHVDRRRSSSFETYTRVMWKYACTRGVAETPSFFVNGIIQPNIKQDWTLANWQSFLDPLLQPELFDDIDVQEHHSQMVNPGSCDHRNSGISTAMTAGIYFVLFAALTWRLL